MRAEHADEDLETEIFHYARRASPKVGHYMQLLSCAARQELSCVCCIMLQTRAEVDNHLLEGPDCLILPTLCRAMRCPSQTYSICFSSITRTY